MASISFWKIKTAIAFHFLMVGFILGNWVARIPSIKSEFGLSDGLFGLVLVSAIFGGCLCLPIISPLITKYGSRAGVLAGSLATIFLVPIIGVSTYGIALLIVGIMGLGFGMAMVDVSMNAHASMFEMAADTHALGFFHANYAMGGFIGAIAGGLFADNNVSPIVNFLIVSGSCLPFVFLFSMWLVPMKDEQDILHVYQKEVKAPGLSDANTSNSLDDPLLADDKQSDVESVGGSISDSVGSSTPRQINRQAHIGQDGVVNAEADAGDMDASADTPWWLDVSSSGFQLSLLCCVAFVASMGEGSINDWTTIYFVDSLHSSELIAAFGFAAFEVTLAGGRLYSDRLMEMYGGRAVLRVAGVVAGAGLLGVVFASALPDDVSVPLSVVCLAVCGCGVSVCSPIVVHMAARMPDRNPNDTIATLTSFIYIALLLGPPFFGGLSSLFGGLKWAFLVDAAILMVVFVCALAMSARISKSDSSASISAVGGSVSDSVKESSSQAYSPIHADDEELLK